MIQSMKCAVVLIGLSLALCANAVADDALPATATGARRPSKVWTRVGPLGETPKHTTDAFPLSDQTNMGRWVKYEPMSDEFEGRQLDRGKWSDDTLWWKGRQPALFSPRNIALDDGKLCLTMRKEKTPAAEEKFGYHDYTSATLRSKDRTAYGYFEVKAKPMPSGGSSSFWFQRGSVPGPDPVTEIDVFEIGGKAKGFERKYNMTVHVTGIPAGAKHWQVGRHWLAPWPLIDDYHVYGLQWDKDELKYFVDGIVVLTVENTHWHYPLFLTFDSETMPEWFGMPDDKDLPSTFRVEYVRAWKHQP
jgi:beta-glucanase (GH16 family)